MPFTDTYWRKSHRARQWRRNKFSARTRGNNAAASKRPHRNIAQLVECDDLAAASAPAPTMKFNQNVEELMVVPFHLDHALVAAAAAHKHRRRMAHVVTEIETKRMSEDDDEPGATDVEEMRCSVVNGCKVNAHPQPLPTKRDCNGAAVRRWKLHKII